MPKDPTVRRAFLLAVWASLSTSAAVAAFAEGYAVLSAAIAGCAVFLALTCIVQMFQVFRD